MENRDLFSSLPAIPFCIDSILIDWLTFVIHGVSIEYVKYILGLDDPSIPWSDILKFRNGYPRSIFFNGITISYGADDPRFYDDPDKVRKDMGICVNLSGSGCRCYETYGKNDWDFLFKYLRRDNSFIASEHLKFISCNITRLDLAFDDHSGILDIVTVANYVKDRNYRSKSKYSEIIWSDDQSDDIQGLNINIGSSKSDIKIRIYDKAAERGFKDRHWIRCEIQLRDQRSIAAIDHFLNLNHIGIVFRSILKNYLVFVDPVYDSNKSRWPITKWWDRLILDCDSIRLVSTPGEPYNFSKTQFYLLKQYGPAISTLNAMGELNSFLEECIEQYPVDDLPSKYKSILYGG